MEGLRPGQGGEIARMREEEAVCGSALCMCVFWKGGVGGGVRRSGAFKCGGRVVSGGGGGGNQPNYTWLIQSNRSGPM